MEMHSRQSLYEIHGISVARRPRRSRLTARLLIARIFTFLTKVKRAIEAELAARRAIAELADMNDHMLRDLGIARSEIESTVRRPRAKVGTNDAPVFSNDTGESYPVLPTVNSPNVASEARPELEPRKLRSSRW
jgi:uncharacterized protein YjiS (DUF1127 family)